MAEEKKIIKLQVRRGPEAQLPLLGEGELAITIDTSRVFYGTGAANFELGRADILRDLVKQLDLITSASSIDPAVDRMKVGREGRTYDSARAMVLGESTTSVVNTIQPLLASELPSAYPVGISVFEVGSSDLGYPDALGTVETKHLNSYRVTQEFTAKVSAKTWVRSAGESGGWGDWSQLDTVKDAQKRASDIQEEIGDVQKAASDAQKAANDHAAKTDNPHKVTSEQVNMLVRDSRTHDEAPNNYPMGISVMFVSSDSGWVDFGVVQTTRGYGSSGATLQVLTPYNSNYGGDHVKFRVGQYTATGSPAAWTAWETFETAEGAQDKVDTLKRWVQNQKYSREQTEPFSTTDILDFYDLKPGVPYYFNNSAGNKPYDVDEGFATYYKAPYQEKYLIEILSMAEPGRKWYGYYDPYGVWEGWQEKL
jgi:hypothetical protein